MTTPVRWTFRLYDSGGVCLWVGLTKRHPSITARRYRNEREWGTRIDLDATVVRKHASPDKAAATLTSWLRHYRPEFREAPPQPTAAPGHVPGRELGLLDRAAAAQARHRALRRMAGW